MSHKLIRLTEKLYNTPHLITDSSIDRIVGYLEDRNSGVFEMAVKDSGKSKSRELSYNPDTKIGYISMDGPLTYIEYEGLCGPSGPSYQAIRDEATQLLKSGAKTIVLDQSSPGGEAYMAFETARYLREQADNYGAKIIAYVDGLSASASYAFSVVADEIIMNPMAEVGSVGVVVKLRNTNKAMKEMGIEDTYVYAGKSKIPFDSEGNFSEETLSDIQRKVDILYEEFVSHVAQFRNIDVQSVIATEAKTFLANDAIALGLADKQMTLAEFSNYLADIVENGEDMPIKQILGFKSKEESKKMTDTTNITEMQAAMSELQATLGAKEEMLAGYVEQMAAMTSQLQEKETLLAAAVTKAEEAQAVSEATKKEMKLKDRIAQLSNAMPAAAAATMAASLEALDDTAFAGVLAGFTAQAAALQSSDLFTQMSASAEEVVEEQQEAAASVDAATKATREAMKARGL